MARITFSEEELNLLQNEANAKYEFVRFTFCDLMGRSRSKQIPAADLKEAIANGVAVFQGCQLFGANDELIDRQCQDTSNCYLYPQSKYLHAVPWASSGCSRIGELICENFRTESKQHPSDSRSLARRQLQQLKNMGFNLLSGFELEMAFMKRGTKEFMFPKSDMFSNNHIANNSDLIYDVCNLIPRNRYEGFEGLSNFNAEYGAGQYEFIFKPSKGLASAEQIFLFRDILKTLSPQRGYEAILMSKLSLNYVGNGLHFSTSLWDAQYQKNLFYDPSSPDNMSALMGYWIGGLCAHAGALTALCCPSVNCYRRLHQPWVPGRSDWAVENRSVAFRVKSNRPECTLVENRLPSTLANPYLVLAATVAAGMDGIRNKTEPLTAEELKRARQLPTNLEEALQKLESDEVMVDALGSDFIACFCENKRHGEMRTLKYFDVRSKETEEFFDLEWEEFAHL